MKEVYVIEIKRVDDSWGMLGEFTEVGQTYLNFSTNLSESAY
ncbi:MAG: hypothetical protein ACW98W_14115 [Candidatus Hodarchaeales archaeon]|jgi:hypothetical protein